MKQSFNNAPDAAVLLLLDGVIVDCSAAVEQLFGVSAADLSGKRLDAIAPTNQADGRYSNTLAPAHFNRALEYGANIFIWTFLIESRQIETAVCYLAESEHQVKALIHPIPHLNDLRIYQQKLSLERDLYKEMVQQSKEAMMLIEDNKIIAFNSTAAALTGRSPEQLLNMSPVELSPEYQPDGQPSALAAERFFNEALLNGAQTFLWTCQKPDLQCFTCEISLSASRLTVDLAPDQPTRFVATMRDVTEALRVSRALTESERQLRQLFEYSPVAMGFLALDGSRIEINEEWSKLFGYPHDAPPTLAEWWENAYPDPVYREQVKAVWQEDLSGAVSDRRDLTPTEYIVHNKQGKPLNILIGGTVIAETILTSFVDMTTQRQSQERLLKLNAELEQRAYTDSLLGIANLNRLMEHLNLIASNPRPGWLALIDIDYFSGLNDSLGHEFGDLVLTAVSNRLQNTFPESLVARIGTDIFAVLATNQTISQEQLQALTQESFVLADQHIHLTATCGLLELCASEQSGEALLQNAHMALKYAKTSQRGSTLLYSQTMGQDLRERMRLLNRLMDAIDQQAFFMLYQPKLDLNTGRVSGLEALIRWKTAEGKFIPPDQFIPLAEKSGQMNVLGEFVFRTSCQQLKRLMDQGWNQLSMAINISQSQLKAPDFIAKISSIIEECQVPPELIELEITETMAAENAKEIGHLLQKIRAMGFKIALDDFGTGFSSLSILRYLPVSRLKIDRSFVNEIHEDNRIARMVLSLSQSLGLQTTAEGIETESQQQLLQQMGCHEGQGWLFAKALSEAELLEFLQRNKPK